MKRNVFPIIAAGILGIVVAYFVTNLLLPEIENVSFKVLSSSVTTSTLSQPDGEVFNYRAVNPTVEVYVGQCTEYNEDGECIEEFNGVTVPEEENTPSEGE